MWTLQKLVKTSRGRSYKSSSSLLIFLIIVKSEVQIRIANAKMSNDNSDDLCCDGTPVHSPLESILIPPEHMSKDFQTGLLPGRPGGVPLLDILPVRQDTVSMPEYSRLLAKCESQERKLKAFRNIHLLIREKEEEIISLTEKNRSYEEALTNSELRHSRLVKTILKNARQEKEIEAGRSRGTENDEEKNRREDDSERRVDSDKNENSQNVRFLESDDIAIQVPEPPVDDDKRISEAKVVVADRECSGDKPIAFVRDALTKKSPGLSQDLVGKLMQQNARLKKVLRDILNARGITAEDYLEKQEYADVVEQLRQELKISKDRVKKLEGVLASVKDADVHAVTMKNSQLQELLLKQNRVLTVKNAMIGAYSKKCEELEEEIKHLTYSTGRHFEYATKDKQEVTTFAQSTTKETDGLISRNVNQRILTASRCTPNKNETSFVRTLPAVGLVTDSEHQQRDKTQDKNEDQCKNEHRVPYVASDERHFREDRQDQNSLTQTESLSIVKTGSPSVAETGSLSSLLVCKRCEREFNDETSEKYVEHLSRCTDN